MRSEHAQKFDLAVARAVAPLNELVSWAKNFLKKGNQLELSENSNVDGRINPYPPALLAFKGGEIVGEIEQAKRQHKQVRIKPVDLDSPGLDNFSASDKKILIVHF